MRSPITGNWLNPPSFFSLFSQEAMVQCNVQCVCDHWSTQQHNDIYYYSDKSPLHTLGWFTIMKGLTIHYSSPVNSSTFYTLHLIQWIGDIYSSGGIFCWAQYLPVLHTITDEHCNHAQAANMQSQPGRIRSQLEGIGCNFIFCDRCLVLQQHRTRKGWGGGD